MPPTRCAAAVRTRLRRTLSSGASFATVSGTRRASSVNALMVGYGPPLDVSDELVGVARLSRVLASARCRSAFACVTLVSIASRIFPRENASAGRAVASRSRGAGPRGGRGGGGGGVSIAPLDARCVSRTRLAQVSTVPKANLARGRARGDFAPGLPPRAGPRGS